MREQGVRGLAAALPWEREARPDARTHALQQTDPVDHDSAAT